MRVVSWHVNGRRCALRRYALRRTFSVSGARRSPSASPVEVAPPHARDEAVLQWFLRLLSVSVYRSRLTTNLKYKTENSVLRRSPSMLSVSLAIRNSF